jgi:phosphoglycolate phosphatase
MNVFFDLDGTLLDSKDRLYQLFLNLTGYKELTFDEYWRLKRAMFSHEWMLKNILKFDNEQVIQFSKLWLEKIEDEEYLNFDRLFDFTLPSLENLKHHRLFVVTSRQRKTSTEYELTKFGIRKCFEEIFITEHRFEKKELIIRSDIKLDFKDLFVGDTGVDINCGRLLGIKAVGVLSGFRDYEALSKYKPDFLLKDISELNKILDD